MLNYMLSNTYVLHCFHIRPPPFFCFPFACICSKRHFWRKQSRLICAFHIIALVNVGKQTVSQSTKACDKCLHHTAVDRDIHAIVNSAYHQCEQG